MRPVLLIIGFVLAIGSCMQSHKYPYEDRIINTYLSELGEHGLKEKELIILFSSFNCKGCVNHSLAKLELTSDFGENTRIIYPIGIELSKVLKSKVECIQDPNSCIDSYKIELGSINVIRVENNHITSFERYNADNLEDMKFN